METLLLTAEDIAAVLTPSAAIGAVRTAFRACGLGQVQMPPKSYLSFPKGDLRSMPACIRGQGLDIAGIKSVNVHPRNGRLNLPTVMALVILTDPGSGFPLAVLDGTLLTALRTGAAGALAVDLLARADARSAGFVGYGRQARSQLTCLLEVRAVKQVKVWQRSRKSNGAGEFAEWCSRTYGLEAFVFKNIDEVTTDVDVLVTTTPSRQPLVKEVSAGTHVNAIGADAEGKQEINPLVLKKARLVVDDWIQASHSGEINVPLRRRQLLRKHIYGELGEIAAGKKKGRLSFEEITVFDSTGLAIQDVACAHFAFEALKDRESVPRIRFF